MGGGLGEMGRMWPKGQDGDDADTECVKPLKSVFSRTLELLMSSAPQGE